jgi:hypothetical protein
MLDSNRVSRLKQGCPGQSYNPCETYRKKKLEPGFKNPKFFTTTSIHYPIGKEREFYRSQLQTKHVNIKF